MVRHFLRGGGGHGENRHFDILFFDERGQFVHAVNRLFGFLVAFAARLGVEGGDDLKSLLFKPTIRQQRQSKMADANENHRLQPRSAEFVGDLCGKFHHIVTQAARAERAETGEVLAELRGFHAGDLRERLAGNRADAVFAQPRKAA